MELAQFTWLPDAVPLSWALVLVVSSILCSAVTAVFSIGGGIVMLALMATILPTSALIPAHGLTQLGSTVSRAWLLREHRDARLIWLFTLGALVGAAIASQIVVALPSHVLQLILGAFILYSTWAPRLRPTNVPLRAFPLVGALTTFIIMFIGSTGPFLASFITPERFGKMKMVATHSTCMAVQHGLKVATFAYLGFDFLPWLPLLLCMMAGATAGSYIGRAVLHRVSERAFVVLFKAALTLMAVRLLYAAMADLL
ncbi:MAG: sulfite exporter TauE/SafE family protein [Gammaproteobacteria bacterium]|nr:sulfite exporter TauE/SafE family protein [Gammaproteobacteria bacterium]